MSGRTLFIGEQQSPHKRQRCRRSVTTVITKMKGNKTTRQYEYEWSLAVTLPSNQMDPIFLKKGTKLEPQPLINFIIFPWKPLSNAFTCAVVPAKPRQNTRNKLKTQQVIYIYIYTMPRTRVVACLRPHLLRRLAQRPRLRQPRRYRAQNLTATLTCSLLHPPLLANSPCFTVISTAPAALDTSRVYTPDNLSAVRWALGWNWHFASSPY